MSNSSSKAALLPEVETFSPLNKASAPASPQNINVEASVQLKTAPEVPTIVSKPIAEPPIAKPIPVINRGGFILAVPGAENLEAPFIESVVSSHGRVASGPLVQAVGSETRQNEKRFKAPVIGLSIAAGILMLSASVYFIGFYGSDNNQDQIASVAPAPSTSLVDHFQGRVPVEPVEGLKPRRVKIETFRISQTQTGSVKVASTGSVRNDNVTPFIAMPRPKPEVPLRLKSSSLSDGSIVKQLQALRDGSRTTPVTIVHIGDSHISSDAFSQGIRDGLQATYGDAGRGAVIPANAYKYARADGVRMTTVGNWSSANSLKVQTGPYGLSGVRVASSSKSAKMTLSTTGTAFDWAEVTVLTGPEQGSVMLSAGGKSKIFNANASLAGSEVVRLDARGNDINVSPAGGGTTTVLNWATGRETAGVRYVNFGISSATAYLQKRWDPKLVANDMRHLNPDLVVWGYGTNEGFNGNLNLASYRNQVQNIYTTLSAAAPQADWLFIGPASGLARQGKAAGYCNGYRIPAKLGAVRTTLKDFAEANGRHFWDWSEAMGGPCAVDQWAKASPKLAAGDRVHLTAKGYRKSADALVAYINGLVEKPQLVAEANQIGL